VDYGLRSRVAIVTGSSSGIGRAIAEAFAAERARVVVTCYEGADRGHAVAASIRDAAGEAFAPPFEALPGDEWRPLLRANVEGVYASIQSVLPSMRAQRWGRIVTISAAAADGMRGGWYSAAKAALHGLTRSLDREVGADGIPANVVMPGLTLSERALNLVPDQTRATAADHTPIGRLLRPADVAAAVTFLASEANTAITGEVIRASGGYVTPHVRLPSGAAVQPATEVLR
jgi:3-oxoacyl-[acyl-carrier protein] reductase